MDVARFGSDRTVLVVPLGRSVAPGESAWVVALSSRQRARDRDAAAHHQVAGWKCDHGVCRARGIDAVVQRSRGLLGYLQTRRVPVVAPEFLEELILR